MCVKIIGTGQNWKFMCVKIIGTGWLLKLICVNVTDKDRFQNVCTGTESVPVYAFRSMV